MKKKLFVVAIIFLISLLIIAGNVRAAETNYHREMAIACAMAWVTPVEGKEMSNSVGALSSTVNYVNGAINIHNYAKIEELDDWTVDSVFGGITGGLLGQEGTAAFTLKSKNSNDLIIVYRSTDNPLDAVQDVIWGIKNQHKQESYAVEYMEEVMEKYANTKENYNIYITGHSLGGYLAQVVGASLYIEKEQGKYSNITIKEIVDFDGMGIDFLKDVKSGTTITDLVLKLGKNSANREDIIEALKKLDDEGKLIEYFTYGDWVSALGVHYGEMRMLYPSIDSISYHKVNYAVLKNFGTKIMNLVSKDGTNVNLIKTDITKAKEFYSITNIAAYLNLTHESDTFSTLDLEAAKENGVKPAIGIVQVKTSLPEIVDFMLSKDAVTKIESAVDVKIKAITEYAAVKKYEWYVSDDGKTFSKDPIKTVDLYNNSNGDEVTNQLEIDIDDIESGKSKFYKVIAYYDDNYVSYKYNEKTMKYEATGKENDKKVEGNLVAVIEIKRKSSSILSGLSSIKSSSGLSGLSNITSIFKNSNFSLSNIFKLDNITSGFSKIKSLFSKK